MAVGGATSPARAPWPSSVSSPPFVRSVYPSCSTQACPTSSFGSGQQTGYNPRPRHTAPSSLDPQSLLVPERSGLRQPPPKVRFFFWLALRGRLWTAARRMCHGLQSSADCALCGQAEETVDHLLSSCVFTREVWFHILQRANMQQLAPGPAAPLVAPGKAVGAHGSSAWL